MHGVLYTWQPRIGQALFQKLALSRSGGLMEKRACAGKPEHVARAS